MTGLLSREAELGALGTAVAEVADGRGSVVLVDGDAGVGKSALIDAVVGMAGTAGVGVFRCWGDELSSAFPLLPLLEAFGVRESATDERRVEIAQVLRGMSATGEGGAELAAAELLLALIDELCTTGPVLLVVDDAQWLDQSTVRILYRLARTTAQRSLLLVAAMRPLPRREDLTALHRLIKAGAGSGVGAVLRLEPLPDDAVRTLVAGLTGGKPSPELMSLTDAAAGNPLYVTELIAALDRAGQLTLTQGMVAVAGKVSLASLGEMIADRLDFLPTAARDVVRAAALLGVDFTASDVAAVLGRQVSELLPAFEDAYHASVLVESGQDAGLLTFRHPLIRAALYEKLPLSVRDGLHRDAAQALHHHRAPVTAVARQLLAVHHDLSLDDWLYGWLASSVGILVNTAPLVVVSLLEPLLPDATRNDARRETLVCALADAWFRLGRHTDAARLARNNVATITSPHLRASLYDILVGSLYDSTTLKQIGKEVLSLATGAEPVYRARLTSTAARAYARAYEDATSQRIASEGLAIAEQIGDNSVIARLLNSLGICSGRFGRVAESLELFERGAAVVADDPTLTDLRLQLLANQAVSLTELDRAEEALGGLTQARILAERIGNVTRAVMLQAVLANQLFIVGRWDEALAECDFPDDQSAHDTACKIHAIAATIAIHRDDPALAAEHLSAGAAHAELVDPAFADLWVPTTALDRERAERPEEALALLVAYIGLANGVEQLLLFPDVVRLAMAVGDVETAEAMTLRAESFDDANMTARRQAVGWHCRGLLMNDPVLLLLAADYYRESGRAFSRAQVLEAVAVQLAGRGEAEAARTQAIAALEIYAGMGASWDIGRLRSALRTNGVRTRLRTAPTRATFGWGALTHTENQVVDLLAQGLSNPQIATRLMLSRRTVETYVSSVLRKLDFRSRVDIALAVANRAPDEHGAPPQHTSRARGA